MPIYPCKCDACGKYDEVFLPVAEHENLPVCCGTKMKRVYGSYQVAGDIQPYQSMVTGEIISSRSKHRQHLKEHGMVEVGNDSSLTKPYRGIPDANPEQRRELLRYQVNQIPDKEWRRMGERHRQEVIRHMERGGKD